MRFDASGGYPGYLLGTSEPEEQTFVEASLGPGGVFYDIGANIGFYSTIAARLVGSEGQVYAFEPHPTSHRTAARNAKLNGFENVRVIAAAVSDTYGQMTLGLSERSAKHRLAEGSGIKVDVVALDEWINRENGRPPTLVMVDVEGHELSVLAGMRETLGKHRPVVCCEVHWLGDRFLDYCRNELAGLDYEVTNLHGGPLPTEGRWHAVLSPAGAAAEPMWTREREFHDALAGELDVDTLAQQRDPDRLDLHLLDLAGELHGRTILDAGCGQGDLTLHLLEQGAKVTALDVSPGMIELVDRRAQQLPDKGRELTTVAAPLERSELPDGCFDLVLGKFILHHVDVDAGAKELRRVLRPGGRAIFIENAGDNFLLTFARNWLAGRLGIPRLGTEDEHPLTAEDIASLRGVFDRATAHYPVFEFLVLFDRQVLRFRFPRASRIIRGIDNAVHRLLPPVRRFSYRVIVELEVASAPAHHPRTL